MLKDSYRDVPSPRLPAVVLHRVPGPAGGAGPVGPSGVPSESTSVRPAVPALSSPAGHPAARRPAGRPPALPLPRGVQVLREAVVRRGEAAGPIPDQPAHPAAGGADPDSASAKMTPQNGTRPPKTKSQ